MTASPGEVGILDSSGTFIVPNNRYEAGTGPEFHSPIFYTIISSVLGMEHDSGTI